MILKNLAHAALYQLHVSMSPGADSLRLCKKPPRMIAARKFKVGELVLLPFTTVLSDCAREDAVTLSVSTDTDKPTWTTYHLFPQEDEALPVGEDNVNVSAVVPFWFLKKFKAQVQLKNVEEVVTIPLGTTLPAGSVLGRSIRKTPVKVKVMFLVNEHEIEVGTIIAK